MLAHIANLQFHLNIDKKEVNATEVFIKINNNKNSILSSINTYLTKKQNFGGVNSHQFCKKLRNRLIHYCDFNSIKFITDYLEEDSNFLVYPNGYYFEMIMYDYFSLLSHAILMFEDLKKNLYLIINIRKIIVYKKDI